jgi:prepilin-type N-terminal cleavage/methylation domain-containing protein
VNEFQKIKGKQRERRRRAKGQKGFSLLELLVAVAILVIVAGAVMSGMIRTTRSEATVMNRTQMHAGVRNATELMEQEIGQAGKLPTTSTNPLTIQFAAAVPASQGGTSATGTVSSTSGLFVGEQLTVDPNSPSANTTNEETVTISAIDLVAKTVTATFYNSHAAGTPIPALVMGGFVSGIIPPNTSSMLVLRANETAGRTLASSQASSSTTLKLFGDIDASGNMYYVVYQCSPNTSGTGKLVRYASTDLLSAATAPGTVLLDNLFDTQDGTSCFTYQTKDVPVTTRAGQIAETFVVNVAVTLSFQTQNKDSQTGSYQWETKALLNISPRNVFDAWELASSPVGYTRAQPMPANVFDNLSTATLGSASY